MPATKCNMRYSSPRAACAVDPLCESWWCDLPGPDETLTPYSNAPFAKARVRGASVRAPALSPPRVWLPSPPIRAKVSLLRGGGGSACAGVGFPASRIFRFYFPLNLPANRVLFTALILRSGGVLYLASARSHVPNNTVSATNGVLL